MQGEWDRGAGPGGAQPHEQANPEENQPDDRQVVVNGRYAADPDRLDLVVYQQIPGPRVLRDARLRVLMAYQGIDYDSLYDAPDGAVFSGRASRLTGGLDISF